MDIVTGFIAFLATLLIAHARRLRPILVKAVVWLGQYRSKVPHGVIERVAGEWAQCVQTACAGKHDPSKCGGSSFRFRFE